MKESELSPHIAAWLRSERYTVYSEIPFHDRCIDMVGLRGEGASAELRVVELKVRYGIKGISQAIKCRLATSDIYLATYYEPMPKTVENTKNYGIGLICVNFNGLKVLSRPRQIIEPWSIGRQHLIDNCQITEPSDEAGKPCMSGCGPAQFVSLLVQEYVRKHPKAGWQEIYENVPNHYGNHKSMAGAFCSYLGTPLSYMREVK